MNSSTEPEWLPATIRYRLNIPRVLHSVSPALSALHTSRVVALHPEISAAFLPSHCLKCGAYYFSGDHTSSFLGSLTRKKRKRAKHSDLKALERRCHVCGLSTDARTLGHSSLPNDLLTTRTMQTVLPTKEISWEPRSSDVPRPATGTIQTTRFAHTPPSLGRQSHPKSNHTKTSTLRDMLSRNREREVASSQKKRKEGREGLAAFLKEL